jgi:hypothetical protein
LKSLVDPLLEAGDVDIETEDFASEGVLVCELLGAPDALQPGISDHRSIMGLRLATGNCEVSNPFDCEREAGL